MGASQAVAQSQARGIAVVTSCSAQGFEQYGRKFIETFAEFWPENAVLYLVSEDTLPVNPATCRTLYHVPLHHNGGWQMFCDRYKTEPRVAKMQRTATKGFRFDAWKFCKKVFATQLAAKRTTSARLLWLDADTFTYEPVPIELFDRIVPDKFALSYLDRGAYHSECGFVGYNMRHPLVMEFIDEFARMYWSGDVFDLAQWQDCFVFDHVRRKMSLPCYRIPHKSNAHPFVYSELGQYMDHLKGNRKQHGGSPEHPYRKPPASKRRTK